MLTAKEAAARSVAGARWTQKERLKELQKRTAERIKNAARAGRSKTFINVDRSEVHVGWFRLRPVKGSGLAQLIEELEKKGYRCRLEEITLIFLWISWE